MSEDEQKLVYLVCNCTVTPIPELEWWLVVCAVNLSWHLWFDYLSGFSASYTGDKKADI